jgi:hypothetical protein
MFSWNMTGFPIVRMQPGAYAGYSGDLEDFPQNLVAIALLASAICHTCMQETTKNEQHQGEGKNAIMFKKHTNMHPSRL